MVGAAEVGFQVLGAGGGDVAQVADVDQARAGRRRRPPVDHLHGSVGVCSAAGGRELGPGARSVPAAQRRLRRAYGSSRTLLERAELQDVTPDPALVLSGRHNRRRKGQPVLVRPCRG